ncbi:MAG: hypothetical protein ACRDG3_03335 [Tepidiformaceae bacterium]
MSDAPALLARTLVAPSFNGGRRVFRSRDSSVSILYFGAILEPRKDRRALCTEVTLMVSRKTLLALLLPLPFAALPLIIVVASMGPNHRQAVVAVDTVPAGQQIDLGAAAAGASTMTLGMVLLPAQLPCNDVANPLIQG